MKNGKGDEVSIEDQNKQLKVALKIVMVIVLCLFVVLSYNVVVLHGLRTIDSGEYITIEDCARKYSLDNLFQLDDDIEVVNGTGID